MQFKEGERIKISFWFYNKLADHKQVFTITGEYIGCDETFLEYRHPKKGNIALRKTDIISIQRAENDNPGQ